MPIWKLTPIVDETSDRWKGSEYKSKVIIRASSEKEARTIATQRYDHMQDIIPRGLTPWGGPWNDPNIVSCQRLEDSRYEEKGPAAILCPNI